MAEQYTEFDLWGNEVEKDVLLREKFMEPPFSVLDTRTGSWQKRKRDWADLGIKSEIGRDAKAYNMGLDANKENGWELKDTKGSGTSIFDPALTELMYKWFCPDGGRILDPFAGGSVRGIVAQHLGYYYTGIDLRQEQIDANRVNALEILSVTKQPNYYCGDSDKILSDVFSHAFDFVFSCPPYMDLEVYSDDKDDLSTMSDGNFISKYEAIIKKVIRKLKHGHYACFVVGEVRDKKTGYYKDFIGITKNAFKAAGLFLYNDMILLNSVGTAALRASGQFTASKKVCKIHQNVLVFKKP